MTVMQVNFFKWVTNLTLFAKIYNIYLHGQKLSWYKIMVTCSLQIATHFPINFFTHFISGHFQVVTHLEIYPKFRLYAKIFTKP